MQLRENACTVCEARKRLHVHERWCAPAPWTLALSRVHQRRLLPCRPKLAEHREGIDQALLRVRECVRPRHLAEARMVHEYMYVHTV